MNLRLPIAEQDDIPLITPYPRGWYVVAESADVPVGDVVPAKAMGRELVVFRSDDGTPHVADAYCPHLGAHLGHGGTVEGSRIRCPFHGWEFDGRSGKCEFIANGDPVPPLAKLRKWHVHERYGVIFVWFHEEGEPPWFEVADLQEWAKKLPVRIGFG